MPRCLRPNLLCEKPTEFRWLLLSPPARTGAAPRPPCRTLRLAPQSQLWLRPFQPDFLSPKP